MRTTTIVLAAGCSIAMLACAEQNHDTQEIIDNLMQAGFPADDITTEQGVVYVGRDAAVSLAASREMVRPGASTKEQYRTTNLVGPAVTKICINGAAFTGAFSTALDLAIQNYDEPLLTFAMARTPSAGCSFTINAVIAPNTIGGFSGFPAGGLPFDTINIGDGMAQFSVNTIAHVITHEIGHTIGFRHSDYFNRSISCGTGGNEEDPPSGLGTILIPGTPSGAVLGGSLMNSCFRSVETGEFTATDVVALNELYALLHVQRSATQQGGFWDAQKWLVGDFNGDGRLDLANVFNDNGMASIDVHLSNGSSFGIQRWATRQGGFWDAQKWLAGDFNGDGRADLANVFSDNGLASIDVHLSTGASFGIARWATQQGGFWDAQKWLAGDFNNDGRADLANVFSDSGLASIDVHLSTGASVGIARWATRQGGFWDAQKWLAGDVTGDGRADLVNVFSDSGLASIDVHRP